MDANSRMFYPESIRILESVTEGCWKISEVGNIIDRIFEKAVHQDSFMKAMKAILETLTIECKKISNEPQVNIKALTYKRS